MLNNHTASSQSGKKTVHKNSVMVNLSWDKVDKHEKLTPRDHAIAGGVSGLVTRCFLQPLDVVKIRFQLQVEPIARRGGGLYQGVIQCIIKIVRTEGPSALWKGLIPAQALSVSYGMGQFASYAYLTKVARDHNLGGKYLSHGVCGGLAGTCGTLVSFPFDVVRTRLVAQGTPKRYSGLVDAFNKMLRQEGMLSLWRGLVPTIGMTAPYTGLIFFFYNVFHSVASKLFGEESRVPWLSISAVSGVAAGASAKTSVYPLDVLKKRLQIRGFETARKQFGKVVVYPSAWKCMVQITLEEGILAWFKGLWPSMLKSGCASGSIFVVYEATCLILNHLHDDKKNNDS